MQTEDAVGNDPDEEAKEYCSRDPLSEAEDLEHTRKGLLIENDAIDFSLDEEN